MDEILSSIRQIIADDDAAAAPTRQPNQPSSLAASLAGEAPMSRPATGGFEPRTVAPAPQPAPRMVPRDEVEGHDLPPLALSPEQIVSNGSMASSGMARMDMDPPPREPETIAFQEPAPPPLGIVDPEDISFDMDEEEEPEPEAEPQMPPPQFMMAPEAPSPSRVASRVADAAPMPDRTLSTDLTEQLIEPATNSAVRHTFARLGAMTMGAPGLTVEEMIRSMLRPMLKEWLDENLPVMVERMVEKEIARISRGVD